MIVTNIQIYNLSDKLSYDEIEEKIIKFKESCGYKICSENEHNDCNILHVITDSNNRFVTVFDSDYSFGCANENKSYIRKLSKALTLPVFSITNMDNEHVIIEQYNFNKRVYDYLSIGNMHEKLLELGFNNNECFNNQDIWKDYFVGRNNFDSINKVIQDSKNYLDKSYIIENIFKLYGLSSSQSLFSGNINSITCLVKTLYFKKV